MNLRQFQELKNEEARLKEEIARLVGAEEQLLTRLLDEHDCQTLEDARRKTAGLRKKLAAMERDWETILQGWRDRWKDKLGE